MSRRDAVQVPDVVSVEHVCRPPRWMVRAMLGMAAALLAAFAVLAFVGVYAYQANEYVQGRGEIRDRETAQLNERIDNAVREGRCDLLDQLPAGGFLDRLRDTFGCGPGIPIEQLPPEIQQRYRTTPTVPAPSSAVPLSPVPPSGSPASPDAPDPVPNKPGTPSPPPDPLVDLGPITDGLCDALGVCL